MSEKVESVCGMVVGAIIGMAVWAGVVLETAVGVVVSGTAVGVVAPCATILARLAKKKVQ